MNLLKKFIAVLGSIGLASSSTAVVVACGPRRTSLTVLLVPSRNPGELNRSTPILSRLLTEQLSQLGFNERVRVTTATNYDMASRSLASGTAAVAYISTFNYYQSAIKPQTNTMHQLFQASRTGMRVEYQIADENLDAMNFAGSLSSVVADETNIYNIVKTNAPLLERAQIETTLEEGIGATYYRGYQYINKKTLFAFYQNGLVNPDPVLREAWNSLVKPITDSTAIFDPEVVTSPEVVAAYWKVAWNIFEQAANNNRLGLSNERTSAAGIIFPIATMIEAWLQVNGRDETNLDDIKEASQAVVNLLDHHYREVLNYGSRSIPDLVNGALDTGIAFADARTQIPATVMSVERILEEVSIFASSHGTINDGAVYSTRYFRNRNPLLHAVQTSFINLIRTNQEAQQIFFENYAHRDYVASPIDDEQAMNAFEHQIQVAQENLILIEAQQIARAIRAA